MWTPQEIKTVLGTELGDLFCRFYNITISGNFESGLNIPHETVSANFFADQEGIDVAEFKTKLEKARKKLFDAREKQIHPLKDDKIITAWNGLMIAAFAKGYQVIGEPKYADAARKSAQFILKKLRDPEGRISRRFREKEVAFPGYLEDYAFLVWGLLELYEAVFEVDYFEKAVIITHDMIELFWDEKEGGFFYSGKGNETLIAQTKDTYDGALPSGNSVAAITMLRLSRMTGNEDLEKKVDRMVQTFSSQIAGHPLASTHFLQALDFALGPALELVIGGDKKDPTTRTMIRLVQKKFLPHKVVLAISAGPEGKRLAKLSSFITPMITDNQKPTVYVCEQFSCKKPMTGVKELESFLSTV